MGLDILRYLLGNKKIMPQTTSFVEKEVLIKIPNILGWNSMDVIRHVKSEFERRYLLGDLYNVVQVNDCYKDKNYHCDKTTKYNLKLVLASVPIVFSE